MAGTEADMRIIISPAKKMRTDLSLPPESKPEYIERARKLLDELRGMPYDVLKRVWACSDALAEGNAANLRSMDIDQGMTAAILAYDGIQYQYMAPETFTDSMIEYARVHLRILSGFYGVLAPLDGIVPYRLEMQARMQAGGKKNLYEFWGSSLYDAVRSEDGIIINLASDEYSKAVRPYLCTGDRMVTCVFGELRGDRIIQKGVHVKMARGEMVRWLAETGASAPEDIKAFQMSGYRFCPARSDETEYVFLKEDEPESIKMRPAFEWDES